jgi:hypothetical protein
MPSRSGMCMPNPKPPDSSPPITAFVSVIFGPTNLKPTPVSCASVP